MTSTSRERAGSGATPARGWRSNPLSLEAPPVQVRIAAQKQNARDRGITAEASPNGCMPPKAAVQTSTAPATSASITISPQRISPSRFMAELLRRCSWTRSARMNQTRYRPLILLFSRVERSRRMKSSAQPQSGGAMNSSARFQEPLSMSDLDLTTCGDGPFRTTARIRAVFGRDAARPGMTVQRVVNSRLDEKGVANVREIDVIRSVENARRAMETWGGYSPAGRSPPNSRREADCQFATPNHGEKEVRV